MLEAAEQAVREDILRDIYAGRVAQATQEGYTKAIDTLRKG
jgi:hypothetical protein